MTAPEPSPGQAAYEAMHASRRASDHIEFIPWAELYGIVAAGRLRREDYEAGAQAAIDVFLAGDTVSAESIREALAAQERPAPGQAETDRERTERLHLAGERDEARSDYSRLRAVLLEGGQSDAAVRKRCLAIIATAGTLPVDAQERPAPGTDPDCLVCAEVGGPHGVPATVPAADLVAAHKEGRTAWAAVDKLTALLAVSEAERDGLRQALDERNAQHKNLLEEFELVDGLVDGDQHGVAVLEAADLARAYADAGYPVRDDLSHLIGQRQTAAPGTPTTEEP